MIRLLLDDRSLYWHLKSLMQKTSTDIFGYSFWSVTEAPAGRDVHVTSVQCAPDRWYVRLSLLTDALYYTHCLTSFPSGAIVACELV
jgi:hypothetical protein